MDLVTKINFIFFFHRSQLSICSEPTVTMKQLSCQSSIDPCVPEEESLDLDDSRNSYRLAQESQAIIESTVVTIESDYRYQIRTRPDSLILNSSTIEDGAKSCEMKKFLYRSQSTKSFKKPKMKPSKVLSNDLDQIYVISSNSCMRSDLNDFYDSIDVIHERRSKNFSKFSEIENDKDFESTQDATRNESIVETTTVDIESHRN